MMSLLAWVLAGPAIALLCWFMLEVLLGLRSLTIAAPPQQRLPRTTILTPAHDEANGIRDMLVHVVGLDPNIGVLVVADNCSDDTAAQARACGAEVIERHDPDRRGKGYALAFGRDHLARLPEPQRPQVVVVLDADCRIDFDSVLRLVTQCIQHDGPVQARYLLVASNGSACEQPVTLSPMSQISNFAMLVKNLIRARGLERIGGGIPLFGTGMAFPWPLFASVPLATDHLVEDMQLALDLAKQGTRVKLVEDARVESAPAPDEAMATQRGRWERGFLGTALSQALPMLLGGIAAGSRHRAALGMHLLVPPLALLLTLAAVLLLCTAVLGLAGARWLPAVMLLLALLGALGAVVAAWQREGRETLTARAALEAPFYVLWKTPMYLGFFRKDRAGWTRTQRTGEVE